jgi:flagellar protein FliO/FliZ
VALAATLLTGPLFAQGAAADIGASGTPNPGASASASAAVEPTAMPGLPLRPSKPLSLEPAPSSSGAAGKLALFAVIAAGGLWVWKRRSKKAAPAKQTSELRVLRRTTIGVRSELLLLELEGQKLLIGVTPSSMQTLYILPDDAREELVGEPASESRIATLLEARIAPRVTVEETRPERRDTTRTKVAPPISEDEPDVEGQAAGLRAIGARR